MSPVAPVIAPVGAASPAAAAASAPVLTSTPKGGDAAGGGAAASNGDTVKHRLMAGPALTPPAPLPPVAMLTPNRYGGHAKLK